MRNFAQAPFRLIQRCAQNCADPLVHSPVSIFDISFFPDLLGTPLYVGRWIYSFLSNSRTVNIFVHRLESIVSLLSWQNTCPADLVAEFSATRIKSALVKHPTRTILSQLLSRFGKRTRLFLIGLRFYTFLSKTYPTFSLNGNGY